MLGQGENVPGPGRERALPFFQPTTSSLDHVPLFRLACFIFATWARYKLKVQPSNVLVPGRNLLFAPWFWYFWHSFATRLSTLLLNYWFAQPKRLPFFIKKFKFIFFLTINNKKIALHKLCTFIFLHALFWNYFKIWCYLLTLFFYYYLLFSFH